MKGLWRAPALKLAGGWAAGGEQPGSAGGGGGAAGSGPDSASFADALLRTDNGTWSVRLAAFADLQRFCCAEQAMTVLRHVEALVKTLEEHVNDAHHRVTQAALEALASYIEQYGAALETFLDRLLPKVFLKISDPKEATRNSAVSVLESARVSYQADVLVPVLLKVLAATNPKIKLGAWPRGLSWGLSLPCRPTENVPVSRLRPDTGCIDFLQYLM